MYKNFAVSNTKAALYSSLLLLPWGLKFSWSFALERLATKKLLMIVAQLILAVLFLGLAIVTSKDYFIIASMVLFLLMGFVAASFDIVSDGFYLTNLSPLNQAMFIGVRTLFFQAARFGCQGFLLIATGYLLLHYSVIFSWSIVYMVLAILLFSLALYHTLVLPQTEQAVKISTPNWLLENFKSSWRQFFKLPNIVLFIVFLLLYNFPEAQLIKVVPLFLLDNYSNAGLQLTNVEVGLIIGVFGCACMVVGALLSGWLLKRFAFNTVLPKVSLLTMLANLAYVLLASFNQFHLLAVYLLIGLAQFMFGLSNSVYLFYLLRKVSGSEFRMANYAMGTGLMAVGMILPGMLSGYLQSILGYRSFFIWIILAGFLVYLLSLVVGKNEYL